MNWLRFALLGCLVLCLTGCSSWMRSDKDKPSSDKSGAGQSSPGQPSPTYHWKRPEDLPRPQLPPTEPGKRDPF